MIVQIFFQQAEFYGIEIKDMMDAAEQRELRDKGNGMGDLGSLLKSLGGAGGAGGQDDILTKLLSSMGGDLE